MNTLLDLIDATRSAADCLVESDGGGGGFAAFEIAGTLRDLAAEYDPPQPEQDDDAAGCCANGPGFALEVRTNAALFLQGMLDGELISNIEGTERWRKQALRFAFVLAEELMDEAAARGAWVMESVFFVIFGAIGAVISAYMLGISINAACAVCRQRFRGAIFGECVVAVGYLTTSALTAYASVLLLAEVL